MVRLDAFERRRDSLTVAWTTGKTKVTKDANGKLDMSLETMSDDLVRLLKEMFPTKAKAPSVVLIGHSMVSVPLIRFHSQRLTLEKGGAVAVDACPKLAEVVDVVGLAVVDVVEGALPLYPYDLDAVLILP